MPKEKLVNAIVFEISCSQQVCDGRTDRRTDRRTAAFLSSSPLHGGEQKWQPVDHLGSFVKKKTMTSICKPSCVVFVQSMNKIGQYMSEIWLETQTRTQKLRQNPSAPVLEKVLRWLMTNFELHIFELHVPTSALQQLPTVYPDWGTNCPAINSGALGKWLMH